MNKLERAEFDLGAILPYVNHLKDVVNQGRRLERRKGQVSSFSLPSGVIFEQPEFKQWVEDSRKPK